MNYVQTMIRDICKEKSIKFNLVSKDWIMVLKKENKIRYISGYKFDLNNHASGIICDDKYALYDTLKLLNIPVAEHKIVFRSYDKNEILDYAEKYKYNLVIKSNNGTCGTEIYHITNKNDIFSHLDELLITNRSVSICPFYEIKNEYRSIIIDDSIELFYGKKRSIVIGDGKKTIHELLCEFNNNFFSKINDKKLDTVLPMGKSYMYSWQHNLSKGSIPFEINNIDLKDKIKKLALDVSKKLNLRFASVDIIELTTSEILILEVNSGVMIDNYARIIENGKYKCKEIYSKAIDIMFDTD